MNEHPKASDWVAARGDKWSSQLSGMESMLACVDAPLIRALHLEAPSRIAEIGCGGGGTALELLRRAPAGSIVHGFDISPKLIELARGRTADVTFETADMATAAPEKPYDRLISRFGVMFFDDPPAAFANLARWLAVDGRFAFAVWGPPSENPWVTSVREVVARIVEMPRQDLEAPGPFRYADADRLLRLLGGAGFSDLDVHEWRGALPIGGGLPPTEAARFALASFSSFGEQLARAGQDAVAEAQRSLTTIFSDHLRDGAVWMNACVRIVRGARAR